MEVFVTNPAKKELFKITKGNPTAGRKIKLFLKSLESVENPTTLPNARKLVSLDNAWRFRLGDYRIESRILETEKGFAITEILEVYKIGHRQGAYKN